MLSFKWLLLPLLAVSSVSVPSTRPIVCAHRGWLAPTQLENSLPQMQTTVAAGIPWIEMDLATSKDGTLYLLHDRTLDRTTTAKGLINTYTDAQLATVYLRAGDNISTQPIPTFAQFIAWLQTNTVHVLVDLKTGDPAQAAAMLRAAGLIPRVIFLSFDPATDAKALAADPQVIVSVLTKTTADIDAAIAHNHPVALYVPHDAAPELFQYAAKTGRTIITDAMDSLDLQAPQSGPAVYRDYLKTRPVTILVTNRALQLREALQ
jgi:glycerophosphoryl diester phosphodiesterase